MPPWVHAFSIAVNLAIIGFGVIFLKTGYFMSEERNSTTGRGLSGVKIMVRSSFVSKNILNFPSYCDVHF